MARRIPCAACAYLVPLYLPFKLTFDRVLHDRSAVQLLPADSIATKIIQLAEKKSIFVWAGRVGFVSLAVAGLLTTFALDLLTVVQCLNAATAIAAVSMVRKEKIWKRLM